MLKCTPVCQLYASDCEGDDLVAYLSCGPMNDRDKVIVSSDKDLYQLLDVRTRMYSLHKKTFVTQENVMEDFRVRSKHFAIAKAICGDRGDNVPGVKGVGFKTVAKLFPILGLEDDIILSDVFDYAHTHLDESRLYKRIIDHRDEVERNWRLVFLNGNMVPANQQALTKQRIADFVPHMDKRGMIKLLVKEGIGDFDVDDFFFSFNGIDSIH